MNIAKQLFQNNKTNFVSKIHEFDGLDIIRISWLKIKNENERENNNTYILNILEVIFFIMGIDCPKTVNYLLNNSGSTTNKLFLLDMCTIFIESD